MKNKEPLTSTLHSVEDEDVTTWALPEGAIARLGRGSVRDIAFSPNGQYLAVASAIGLWLYEFPTLSPIALWDTERGMTDSVVFSPDSRRIVTHTFVEDVKVWDIESGICTRQIEVPNRGDICHPVFSQDGQHLIAANFRPTRKKNQKIYVWCPHTGAQMRETQMQHPCNIYPLCFSPDLSLLAGKHSNSENIGGNVSDGDSIVVWDVEMGEQVTKITEYPGRVRQFCFSPCGKLLAAGDWHGNIHVWNVVSGKLETTYAEYGDFEMYPYFRPGGELIAASVSKQEVEIWDVEQHEKLDGFEHRGHSRRVYFSEKGHQLAVASESDIQIWTKGGHSNPHTLSILHGHISTMDTLAFSADEKTLAAGFWRDNILLWDVASRRSYRPQGEKLPATSHNVYCSPNGKIISINTYGNNLNVQEVDKRESLVELASPGVDLGRAKAFASTGDRIASVDRKDNIHIWECTSSLNDIGKSENWKKHPTIISDAEFIDGLRFSPTGLAFSPDGKRLASISRSRDWKAGLWDVDTGKQIAELPTTPSPKHGTYRKSDTGIAFSPRGDIIAGGLWNEIVLWNATEGKIIMTLPQSEENQRPITLHFSPCGEYLVSGAWWKGGLKKVSICLWEVASGKNIATFWGHTTDVQCFAFSEDGTLLISGGHDGAIYLWDLTSSL